MKVPLALAVPAVLLLASCQAPPGLEARAGEGKRVQVARFARLFTQKEGLHDVVLVTRDFREELAQLEHTTILASRAGTYSSIDLVTFDRKQMGKDRVRHVLGGIWPVDMKDDPENRTLLWAEATGEFLSLQVAADPAAGPPPPPPGILTLGVKIRFIELQRNGEISVAAPQTGDVGKSIAKLLEVPAEERPPLAWSLLLEYHLAERDREAGSKAKAAAAYQRIIDTVTHTRAGPDADDHERALFDCRNIDYVSEMAKKNLAKAIE